MSLKYLKVTAKINHQESKMLILKSLNNLKIDYSIIEEKLIKIQCSYKFFQDNIDTIQDDILKSETPDFLTKIPYRISKLNDSLNSSFYKLPLIGKLYKKTEELGESIGDGLTKSFNTKFGDSKFKKKIDEINHVGDIAISLNQYSEFTNIIFTSKNDLNESYFLFYFYILRNEIKKRKSLDLAIVSYDKNVESEEKLYALINENHEESLPNVDGYHSQDKIENQKIELNQIHNNTHINKEVFISYNHKDKSIAKRIINVLEKSDIVVKIDSHAMKAGDDIQEFIFDSIRDTQTTLSIVSTNSLMSSWVSMESITAITAEELTNKKFIGAYVDNSLFEEGFVEKALNNIEKEIDGIQSKIKIRLDKDWNIDDLSTELRRYYNLKHSLPTIIDKLKSSLTVDITVKNFDTGMNKIIKEIKA